MILPFAILYTVAPRLFFNLEVMILKHILSLIYSNKFYLTKDNLARVIRKKIIGKFFLIKGKLVQFYNNK